SGLFLFQAGDLLAVGARVLVFLGVGVGVASGLFIHNMVAGDAGLGLLRGDVVLVGEEVRVGVDLIFLIDELLDALFALLGDDRRGRLGRGERQLLIGLLLLRLLLFGFDVDRRHRLGGRAWLGQHLGAIGQERGDLVRLFGVGGRLVEGRDREV